MRTAVAMILLIAATPMAQAYTVTTTTTTTKNADGTVSVETTQSAPYSAGRCAQLMVDQNMLIDQLRRTGWKLEQDLARAQLAQVQEEIILRRC
ncbi:hypothetical protein [Cupriavidus sp. D39]|uniref:hypothetical protein n=1 Tax=Cupriavidus sp. D39 TaxID=2997877 RepID=UPI002270C0FF|nr:hypothetical protein [Cupriavidus sp. D39]MCY0852703.1 hypothetical protein [Cupriavidus sp. D39]